MMQLGLIRFRFKPGQMATVRQIYNTQIIPAIRATAGHHSSHFTEGVTDPDEAMGWIVWDELRFADAYIETGAYAGHLELIRPFLAEEPEIRGYRPL